jgi:SulP family sulfate permease
LRSCSRSAKAEGITLLLAGVRPDLLRGMSRLRFDSWSPREHWFLEEDDPDSATLKAVRKAYELLGIQRPAEHAPVYYLV